MKLKEGYFYLIPGVTIAYIHEGKALALTKTDHSEEMLRTSLEGTSSSGGYVSVSEFNMAEMFEVIFRSRHFFADQLTILHKGDST